MTCLALLLVAPTILVSGCGHFFYEEGLPNKVGVYLDERTGQLVPEVSPDNYGKQWPQRY